MSLFQRILLSTAVLMGMLLVGVFAYEKGLEEGRTGQVAVPTFQGRAASEWAQMYQDLDAYCGLKLEERPLVVDPGPFDHQEL